MPSTASRTRQAWDEHRIIRPVDEDPAPGQRVDGSVWYNRTEDELRAQIDGEVRAIPTAEL